MTTLSIRDGHELGIKQIGHQLVFDLSFESVNKLDIVLTNWKIMWELVFYKYQHPGKGVFSNLSILTYQEKGLVRFECKIFHDALSFNYKEKIKN